MPHKDPFNTAQFSSVPQAARYHGVGRQSGNQVLENGRLIFTPERGAIRIWAESVDAFGEGHDLSGEGRCTA